MSRVKQKQTNTDSKKLICINTLAELFSSTLNYSYKYVRKYAQIFIAWRISVYNAGLGALGRIKPRILIFICSSGSFKIIWKRNYHLQNGQVARFGYISGVCQTDMSGSIFWPFSVV